MPKKFLGKNASQPYARGFITEKSLICMIYLGRHSASAAALCSSSARNYGKNQ